MLMSLLLAMTLSFLSDKTRFAVGVNFSAQTILRFRIGILSTRISCQLAVELGSPIIFLVIGGVTGTSAFGIAVLRLFGFRIRFAFLFAGSVAICGFLPQRPYQQYFLRNINQNKCSAFEESVSRYFAAMQ